MRVRFLYVMHDMELDIMNMHVLTSSDVIVDGVVMATLVT
jgi:hypothetical protein